MSRTGREQILRLLGRRGVLGTGEATRLGVHSQALTRLVADGVLKRVARGRYRLTSRPITEHHGLVVVARAVPLGVICLLSALEFHGIGTQLPAEVWVAIDRRARAPTLRFPPLRVTRFGGLAFTEGVETHRVERETVRIFGVAKTLADLFKYRNRIGIDVALEALREAWQTRRVTMAEIDRFARICRVERVMRPYLEALAA